MHLIYAKISIFGIFSIEPCLTKVTIYNNNGPQRGLSKSDFMLFNKLFKIKYKKNKYSYSWQDQPTKTTDHKSKLVDGQFKCNRMVQ